MKMMSVSTNAGVRTLPMRSTNFEGEDANQYTTPKKTARKIGSATPAVSAERKGRTAISKETVPVRGTAKQGPIAR